VVGSSSIWPGAKKRRAFKNGGDLTEGKGVKPAGKSRNVLLQGGGKSFFGAGRGGRRQFSLGKRRDIDYAQNLSLRGGGGGGGGVCGGGRFARGKTLSADGKTATAGVKKVCIERK